MLRLLRVAFVAGFLALSVMYQRHPENPSDDPLFTRFPLSGSYQSSVGQIKVPFHGYDGDALIIVCKANATAVQAILNEGYFALRTVNDEAIAFVWVMKYKDTSVGPYSEVVLTFLATSDKTKVKLETSNAFAAFSDLYYKPSTIQYVYKLWVDTEQALEWGRTVVGFDKSMGKIEITRTENVKEFKFTDSATMKPILNGKIIEDDSLVSQFLLFPEIVSNMGVGNVMTFLSSSYNGVISVSPKGISPYFKKHNPMTYAEFALNPLQFQMKFQHFTSNDKMEVQWGEWKAFNLQPTTYARDPKIRFIFTTPFNFVEEK